MGQADKPTILIINSIDPTKGSAIGASKIYNLLKNAGYEVDLLTKYKIDGHPEFISVYDRLEKQNTWQNWVRSKIEALYYKTILRQKKRYYFFYRKETSPPVPVNKVLKKITKNYDIVHIYFWQGLLSFHTVRAIYEKFHCYVRFACADYSIMSGGCHFTGECEKYKWGCGKCPAIYSHLQNDFTSFNVQYRKCFLSEIKPVVSINNYMKEHFFMKSYLYKDYDRIIVPNPLLDLNEFRSLDKLTIRKKYQIPDNKRFLMFFGSISLGDSRKGASYLLNALRIFYNRLNEEERDSILLLLAGKNIDEIQNELLFDYQYLGFLDVKELPQVYSLADVFLSPSVNDAGPLMLIQSIACGTPVVAFEMGYALDFVKNRNTGYCATLRDANSFADGIYEIYSSSPEIYLEMSKECRMTAEKYMSADAYIEDYMSVYRQYQDK